MQALRETALCSALCVKEGSEGAFEIEVFLHNERAGHGWPSGAIHSRRGWLELVGYHGGAQVFGSGVVAEHQSVMGQVDSSAWVFRGTLFDESGEEVMLPWRASTMKEEQLPMAETLAADSATWRSRLFFPETAQLDRVTSRVRLRPVDREFLRYLVEESTLDQDILSRVQTFDFPSTRLEWTPTNGVAFCGLEGVDCGDHGTCVTPINNGLFSTGCLPPQLATN
jgi:hypothetical protein